MAADWHRVERCPLGGNDAWSMRRGLRWPCPAKARARTDGAVASAPHLDPVRNSRTAGGAIQRPPAARRGRPATAALPPPKTRRARGRGSIPCSCGASSSRKGSPEITARKTAVEQQERDVGECPPRPTAPMAAAVVGHLEHGAKRPKQSDPCGQPATDLVRAKGHLAGKPPRHHREDDERHRDEPRVNLEHLA